MRRHALILLTLLLPFGAMAQQGAQKPLKVGLGLSASSCACDLNYGGEALTRFYPGMGFSLQFASERLLSPQLNAGFGKFVAQDRDIPALEGIQPNTYTETPHFHADFRIKARFLRTRTFIPFVSAGIGLLGYTPKDLDGHNLLDNVGSRREEEVYGSLTAGFPLSTGTEIHLSHFVSLGLEYTFRPTGTDYLDNIGLLGPRDGKDKLHSLWMGIYFTIDPELTLNPQNMRGRDRR